MQMPSQLQSSQRGTRPSPNAVWVLPSSDATVLGTIQDLRATPLRVETLTSRLRSNDPTLTSIKLNTRPLSLFDDFGQFLEALKVNKTVKSVGMVWRFLSMLPESARVELMQTLGSLASLEKLYVEAIGPCHALAVLLEKAQRLKTLWVGSLRISSNHDIENLAQAFLASRALYQVNLSNLKIPVQVSPRVDADGTVWSHENGSEKRMKKLNLDPLMEALASVPTLKKIQMELGLNLHKMDRLKEESIEVLCQAPRTYLMMNACGLDDRHCFVLAKELTGASSTLEDLVISQNPDVTAKGWEAIATMTELNCCLTGIYTPSDPALAPTSDCRTKMDFYLRLNQAGRDKLLRSTSSTHEDWLVFLTEHSNNISMVFYALKVAPSLFT